MKYSQGKLSAIDLVRIIAAAAIIMLHSFIEDKGFMNVYGGELLTRWAVGFFFMVSGFFMKKDFKGILKYCIRIFIVYFVWTVIYALLFGENIWTPWNMFSALRSGIIMPFWYFPSLITCIVFVWLLNKLTKNESVTLAVCLLLYVVALLGNTYMNVAPVADFMNRYFFPVFARIVGRSDTRDGIFNGSLYIAIGLWLSVRQREGKLDIKDKKKFLIIALIALFLFWAEIYLLIRFDLGMRDVLIMSPVLCSFILVFAINHEMDEKKAVFCRDVSSLVFLMHYGFLNLMQALFAGQWQVFIATCVLSFAAAIAITLLSRKIRFLNFLY